MSTTTPRLAVLVIDYLSRIPVDPSRVAPSRTVLAIYAHNTKTWRVAEIGAWLEDDEDSYIIELCADARGGDVELACTAVLSQMRDESAKLIPKPTVRAVCELPGPGWSCRREPGHEPPCWSTPTDPLAVKA